MVCIMPVIQVAYIRVLGCRILEVFSLRKTGDRWKTRGVSRIALIIVLAHLGVNLTLRIKKKEKRNCELTGGFQIYSHLPEYIKYPPEAGGS